MCYRRFGWMMVITAALGIISLVQALPGQAPCGSGPGGEPCGLPRPRDLLASIPVPYDPLELVANGAQQVRNPEERAAALELLQKAHRLSNVRLHAYDLKTSFVSYGESPSDGRWMLEDISPGANVYRWEAQGPAFSGVFLNVDKLLSSNQPGGAMPLRLAQVRDAIWGVHYPEIGPHATVRLANGFLAGGNLQCVLVARGFYGSSPPQFPSGRSFDESEYCVNRQTGLLETYSPAAGLYVRYDYGNALHFHNEMIPNGFIIAQHGKTVVEAKTDSVADAPPQTSNLFEPAGLNPLGVGQVIVAPLMVRGYESSSAVAGSAQGQVVVIHGMVSPQGRLSEAEVLASTNESLDEAAVAHATRAHALELGKDTQPGTTPQSREVIFTVEFLAR